MFNNELIPIDQLVEPDTTAPEYEEKLMLCTVCEDGCIDLAQNGHDNSYRFTDTSHECPNCGATFNVAGRLLRHPLEDEYEEFLMSQWRNETKENKL